MKANTTQTTQAFLLHRRMYGGNGLLLDLLTKDLGFVRCLNKNIRKSKQNIQPFSCLQVNIKGKNELKTLLDFEINDTPRVLKKDTLILAVYINELLSRVLSPLEPHTDIFKLYQNLITKLPIITNHQKQQHWALRLFEKQLLDCLGLGLDYSHDSLSQSIQADYHYYFKAHTGFVLAKTGDISGELLLCLHIGEVDKMPDDFGLRLSRILLQTQLQPLLGNKPLKSRALIR